MLFLRNELKRGCKWEIPSELNYPLRLGKTYHTWTICEWLQPKKNQTEPQERQVQFGQSASSLGGLCLFSGTVIFWVVV